MGPQFECSICVSRGMSPRTARVMCPSSEAVSYINPYQVCPAPGLLNVASSKTGGHDQYIPVTVPLSGAEEQNYYGQFNVIRMNQNYKLQPGTESTALGLCWCNLQIQTEDCLHYSVQRFLMFSSLSLSHVKYMRCSYRTVDGRTPQRLYSSLRLHNSLYYDKEMEVTWIHCSCIYLFFALSSIYRG